MCYSCSNSLSSFYCILNSESNKHKLLCNEDSKKNYVQRFKLFLHFKEFDFITQFLQQLYTIIYNNKSLEWVKIKEVSFKNFRLQSNYTANKGTSIYNRCADHNNSYTSQFFQKLESSHFCISNATNKVHNERSRDEVSRGLQWCY